MNLARLAKPEITEKKWLYRPFSWSHSLSVGFSVLLITGYTVVSFIGLDVYLIIGFNVLK